MHHRVQQGRSRSSLAGDELFAFEEQLRDLIIFLLEALATGNEQVFSGRRRVSPDPRYEGFRKHSANRFSFPMVLNAFIFGHLHGEQNKANQRTQQSLYFNFLIRLDFHDSKPRLPFKMIEITIVVQQGVIMPQAEGCHETV